MLSELLRGNGLSTLLAKNKAGGKTFALQRKCLYYTGGISKIKIIRKI
jgi:hypothetical protein